MKQQPEILVHISAPSRLSDDAQYRQQALSFLGFEPVRRHALTVKDDSIGHDPATWQSRIEEDHSSTRSSAHRQHEDSEKPASPPQVLRSFTSLLFQPSSSNHTTTSHIPETTFKPTTKSAIHITRTPFPPTHTKTGPHCRTPTIQETPLLRRAASDSWTTPPSVIPDSQPTPAQRKRPLSSSPSPTHVSSSTTKRLRVLPAGKPFLELAPPLRSSSPLPALTSPPLAPTHSPTLFRPSTLSIHPPRPPVSAQKFKTHLTSDLSALAAKPQLQGYHTSQIASQVRALRVHERGHWLVPLKGLSEEEKQVLWEFLGRFVGRGKAGWGVWCVLEGVPEIEDEDRGGGGDYWGLEEEGKEEEMVVKVYCWGEVVEEVWNVLFLGTGKKVKGSGARWVGMGETDGVVEEEVIIWMK